MFFGIYWEFDYYSKVLPRSFHLASSIIGFSFTDLKLE